MTITNKLKICKQTRKIAADSLYVALKELLETKKEISEVILRNSWLSEMRKYENIFSDGWYIPPPHGIGVLFGSIDRKSRQNYKSLRPAKNWPQEGIFLDKKNEMAYVYASPVDRKTGIIGDMGMSLYFGNNKRIKDHLKLCLQLDKEIFEFVQVKKSYADIYRFAIKLFEKFGLSNQVTSITDPASVNIGHTIPSSYEDWTADEFHVLEMSEDMGNPTQNLISKKRKFINSAETLEIRPGMAFTIEPRPTVNSNPEIPMASYHTTVVIHTDGKKELLTYFDSIFKLIGMEYMLD